MAVITEITLAGARVNAGLSQEKVAETLGISVNTLIAWEKGNSEPKITQARSLAKLYKVPLDCLIFLG